MVGLTKVTKVAALVLAAGLATGLAGCGGSSANADATCGDYSKMSSSERTDTIKAMIAKYGQKYGDQDTPAKRAEYKVSITGFCAFNTDDTKLAGIYGNGGNE